MQGAGAAALALALFATSGVAVALSGARRVPDGVLTAVLVAASSGADSRRHQADVLAQYQLLRANGVDDDQIVLLTARPLPAVVRVDVGGPNLAAGAVVDGAAGELGDVLSLLDTDRLYLFVAGHGDHRGIRLEHSSLTPTALATMLPPDLQALVAVEACDSGVFTTIASEDIAVLTASGPDEDSVATNLDRATGVWLADEFSVALSGLIRDDVAVSLDRARAMLDEDLRSSTPMLGGGDDSWSIADFVTPWPRPGVTGRPYP